MGPAVWLYANRRAEMWDRKRIWYDDAAGVQVPDSDEFQGDECSHEWGPGATHFRSNGQLQLEAKEHVKSRLGYSPDLGDAHALTFAVDMEALNRRATRDDWRDGRDRGPNGWTTRGNMPLTRQAIVAEAERYGFEVKGFEPGPGTRADVVLWCKKTEQSAKIGIWPCSTEQDLLQLLGMAIAKLRGRPPSTKMPNPDAWLM